MKKSILIILGLISLGIGVLGIFVPGLPTTVFLLFSAWAFVRSSDRLYTWLIEHRILGRYIKDFATHKSMKISTKIYAIGTMSSMIFVSTYFVLYPRLGWVMLPIMSALGLAGIIAVLLVPTRKQ